MGGRAWYARPLRDMACQCEGGTHPTGMHSCFIITKSSGTIDQLIPCRPSPSTLRLALLSETLVKFMSNFDIVHVRKQHKVTLFSIHQSPKAHSHGAIFLFATAIYLHAIL